MTNTKAYLLYCSENQNIADDLMGDLARVQLSFTTDTFDAATHGHLKAAYQYSQSPVFLLVTDNFLKSEDCMKNVLDVVNDGAIKDRIKVIIADGTQRNPATGEWEAVPTNYERLGDVVHYIDYWSVPYQAIRTEMRHASESEKHALEPRLAVVQEISTTVIGEFMRYLRSQNVVTLNRLKREAFRPLFERFGAAGTAMTSEYRSLPIYMPPQQLAPETEEMPDVSGIPGLDLLPNYEDVVSNNEEADNAHILDDLFDDLAEELVEEAAETELFATTAQDTDVDNFADNAVEGLENDLNNGVEDDILNEVIDEIAEDVTEEITETAPVAETTETAEEAAEELISEITDSIANEIADELETPQTEEVEQATEAENEAAATQIEVTSEQSPLEIAEDLARNGDLEGATALYQRLIENAPEDVDLRYAFALMLIENGGDLQLAKTELLKANELDPEDEDVLFELGKIAESEGEYELARTYYERVILLDLENEQAYYQLGKLLANRLENQEFVASSYLQRAISLDDEFALAYLEYAKLLKRYFGKHKKALKYFKRALKYDKNLAEAHFYIAEAYAEKADAENALTHYDAAVQLDERYRTDENEAKYRPQPEVEEVEALEAAAPPTPAKTVFITGATSGIGKATAELFAQSGGYRLILTGRRAERLEALKSILETEYNTEVLTLVFDVRIQPEVAQAVAELPEAWRTIDILVNNAGLAKGFSPIHEGDLTHWETMIDTNIKGLLYVTRAISPLMVAQQHGFIINIGSIAGKETYTNGNVYCATKSAVDVLTKGMRLDLSPHNIRVAVVHPGHVTDTEFALVRFDGDAERAQIYDGFQPLKASDVADTVYYIATRPPHVNIEQVVMFSTQQSAATIVHRK